MDVTTQVQAGEGAFVVELDRFQGPLDLLLHLIREQDIDIFDIPIAKITAQFLRAIEGVERLGLDRAGEFLEMAAMLIRIKAQMLLPQRADLDGEFQDPRAELVRRLLEYEHYRDAARRLEEAERDRGRHYTRGYIPPRPRPDHPAVVLPLELEWEELWTAILAMSDRVRPAPEHLVAPRAVPMEDKIWLILDTLSRLGRVEFQRLVSPFGDRQHAVVTLLAGLELARRRDVSLRQRSPFTVLWIYRASGRAAHEVVAGD